MHKLQFPVLPILANSEKNKVKNLANFLPIHANSAPNPNPSLADLTLALLT
jgi:hypothetical protein